jgi:SAM-dependent methyltransferase
MTTPPIDPLAGSPWSTPETVSGFVSSPPNQVLLGVAKAEFARRGGGRLIDIGCGAARNAAPLARIGWRVLGTDLSWPMLRAAADRVATVEPDRLRVVLAPMDDLPVATGSIDFLVAHGVWNLAPSSETFRRAVAEAARVARPGAALFVFTFSRHTLPPDAEPVPGEQFVFTQFSGHPQCFLTERELIAELATAGFDLEPGTSLTEYNRPGPGALARRSGPVIYEGLFRRR